MDANDYQLLYEGSIIVRDAAIEACCKSLAKIESLSAEVVRLRAEIEEAAKQNKKRLELLREIWQSDDVSWVSHRSETFRKLAKELGDNPAP